MAGLNSDSKCNTPGRFDIGKVDQDLEECCHAILPLVRPSPRGGRFGSPLVLSRVHWVRPEMVVEVSYAEWTPDGLLRHVVYLGERRR